MATVQTYVPIYMHTPFSCRLVGLVGKAFASRAAGTGSNPAFAVDLFSRSSHTSDLKTGTPVAKHARRLVLQGQRWDWLAGISIL